MGVIVADGALAGEEQEQQLESLRLLLVRLAPDHPSRWEVLDALGRLLRDRYGIVRRPALLDEALTAHREAFRLAPRGAELMAQFHLANALLDVYDSRTDDPGPLEEAMDLLRSAQASGQRLPGSDVAVRRSLASGFERLWSRYGREEDLRASIDLLEQAVAMAVAEGNRSAAGAHSSLADRLVDLFDRSADPRHLDAATKAADRALSLAPPGHPDRPMVLDSVCRVGNGRYGQDGDVAHLERAEKLMAEACALDPAVQGIDRGTLFSGWAIALLTWYEATGEPRLLDRALAAQRTARDATVKGDVNWAGTRGNLAVLYGKHANATGDTTFLPEARSLWYEAIEAAVPRAAAGHRRNLAMMLLRYAKVLGEPPPSAAPDASAGDSDSGGSDSAEAAPSTVTLLQDEAIRHLELAVEAVPGHDAQGRGHAIALASQLTVRYDRRGHLPDHDRAVEILLRTRDDAESAGAGEGDAARCRFVLAYLRQMRALDTLTPDDLARAETAFREARSRYRGVPANHEVGLAAGLAEVLATRAELPFADGRPLNEDFVREYQEVLELRRESAEEAIGSVTDRIRGAHAWGRAAARVQDWAQAHRAYDLAFSLVPALAPQHLRRTDRETLLTVLETLATDAAACALSEGDEDAALQFLEAGRGLFLTESLGLREEEARLGTHAPRMGERFLALRAELAASPVAASEGDGPPGVLQQGEVRPRSEKAVRAGLTAYRERAAEMDEVLGFIRRVPGLERFLLPPETARLLGELDSLAGPVVVVNVAWLRCDALIVHDGAVELLPLEKLTLLDAEHRFRQLESATTRAADHALPLADREAAENEIVDVQDWLWDKVAAPVTEQLARSGVLGPPPPTSDRRDVPVTEAQRPRLWWCLTGPLCGMPLHAAAARASEQEPRPGDRPTSVLDLVVSSYATTLSSLARSRAGALGGPPRALAVGLGRTPGLPHLPAARLEVAAVREWATDAELIEDAHATRAAVLAALREHDWVHFAGHAQQRPAGHDNGHLMCHDHATAGPLSTGDIAEVQFAARSFLAYLAACETARGRATLTGQAMHLAGAMQSVGFAHVIAAFWLVHSSTALLVARGFYLALGQGAISHESVARALDAAVRDARQTCVGRPSWWMSFHHVGP